MDRTLGRVGISSRRGGSNQAVDDTVVYTDDEDDDRPRGVRWRPQGPRCRRMRVPPALLAGAATLGVFIWLLCVWYGDILIPPHLGDAVQEPSLPSSEVVAHPHLSTPLLGEPPMETEPAASAHRSSSHVEAWNREGDEGTNATSLVANLSINRSSSDATTALLSDLIAALRDAEGRLMEAGLGGANASVSILFNSGAANWLEPGDKGRARLRRKREEIRQRGEKIEVGLMSLHNAIAHGEVHKGVVFGVIAAFVSCVAALQVLGATRGELRRAVRRILTRSIVAPPAPNELMTRPYATWIELLVRVSIDFLNEPANVMLLSIGSLQVLATWSKADPLRCKKINLLVLLANYAYSMVQEVRAQHLAASHDAQWNFSCCLRIVMRGEGACDPDPHHKEQIVLAKDLEVGDLLVLRYGDVCPAPSKIVWSSHRFVLFNAICETGEDCCMTLVVGSTALLGFVVALQGAEVHVRVMETRNGSSTLVRGDSPSDIRSRPLSSKYRHMERFPEHMNKAVTHANLFALGLLFSACVIVCGLKFEATSSSLSAAVVNEAAGSTTFAQVLKGNASATMADDRFLAGLSTSEALLVTHFFSTAVQLNTFIPSMRWVILFFMYIFLVEASRLEVRIRNWRGLQGLDSRRILYSDKTGTLTEVRLSVSRLRNAGDGEDIHEMVRRRTDPSRRNATSGFFGEVAGSRGNVDAGAGSSVPSPSATWLAAILLACNDAQPRPPPGVGGPIADRRPGTSPEEIAIADHLESVIGISISCNPLGLGALAAVGSSAASAADAREGRDVVANNEWPLVLKDVATGRELVRGLVSMRSDFDPRNGFREAIVLLPCGLAYSASDISGSSGTESWIVRQGGADIMAELAGCAAREAALAAEDRDRALGWCVAPANSEADRIGGWRYVMRCSFKNPPRATSAPMVAHCRATGVAVRMITGDAEVAALHIAREIGILCTGDIHGGFVSHGGHVHSGIGEFDPLHLLYEPGEAPAVFANRMKEWLVSTPGPVCVGVPGAILRGLIEAEDGSDLWLGEERVSAVIYRTRAADKAFLVRRTEDLGRLLRRQRVASQRVCGTCVSTARRQEESGVCIMMGDASNDAEAIGLDNVVGISLAHGAAPCQLVADFIVAEPGALVAVRSELFFRALTGATWLLEDVCFLCGLVASLTLCGVWAADFKFLPRGFLYDDPFDARIMTLFSSGLYAPSACVGACAASSAAVLSSSADSSMGDSICCGGILTSPRCVLPLAKRSWRSLGGLLISKSGGAPGDGGLSAGRPEPRVVRMLLLGTAVGSTLGLLGPDDDLARLGRWIIMCTATIMMLRHASNDGWCRRCLGLTSMSSTAAEQAAVKAMGPPNCLAMVLERARAPWVRMLALALLATLTQVL